ncbi:hypothetical protein Tco_0012799 [Tanacetum coccineum]
MNQDSAHMVAASKVPMLKPGEFELWSMRIEQYTQMIDYALWEVIENDKGQRRLEVKARTTKKTQRNLLKQQYENFTAPSSEMLDQTFDRLQKLVSQLELLDENLSQEDVRRIPKWSATTATRGDILLGSAELQENINGLKWDIQVGEITIRELRKKLEKIQKEKDSIQFNVDNLKMHGLDEFVNKPVVENRKSNEEVPKVSDSEEENVSQTKTEKKTIKPSIVKKDFDKSAKLILREWHVYFEVFQNRFKRDVKEMKDVFVSVENDLDETFKQNELLKDRLLEASLAEDIKNLVITSCVEIRNKDLHDETERISHESKEVSNESKTADTVCNDAFKITQELSKRIVELEKDLSKFEAKCIAFEIAHSHMARENNYLKTLQKENENFMGSLQIEIAHLKQTYKDLFDSVQRSRVETNECDEVKVKVDFVD